MAGVGEWFEFLSGGVLGGRGEGEVTVEFVYPMKALGEVEVQLHSSLTSNLDGLKI